MVQSQAVFLDLASLHPADLDLSALTGVVENWQWHDGVEHNEVDTAISDAAIVVTNKVVLQADTLAAAKNLRLVCIAATGVNNVDLEAAERAGITVCNVPAYATPSVAQHVFALLLSLTTGLPRYQQAVAAGDWSRSPFFCLFDYPVRELPGLTLGIIGYGESGRAVASLAEAFGMKVVLAKRNDEDARPGRLALADLLASADVVSIHCPLTTQTRGLIGESELALMKRDAVLINTARGGIVDEAALHAALKAGRIAGAALDVLEQEPPPADHILLRQPLPNLIITPHIAWASRQSRQRLVDAVAKNIQAFIDGNPVNVVNATIL